MAKIGRPNVENKRRINMSWRATEEEYERIKSYAAEHNMTMSQVVQKGVDLLCCKAG